MARGGGAPCGGGGRGGGPRRPKPFPSFRSLFSSARINRFPFLFLIETRVSQLLTPTGNQSTMPGRYKIKREQEDAAVPAPKMKFVPKIPQRKQSKTSAAKWEPTKTKDYPISKELLAKINSAKSENSFARKRKGERNGKAE